MTPGLWAIVALVGYFIGREAIHQFIKSRQFKRVCEFLEKASR